MRFWIGSCLLVLLAGCASEEQRPTARAVDGSNSFEEAASRRRTGRGPTIPRLEPKTVRAFPENPHKPAWKGPKRSALELDPGAQAEVDATNDLNAKSAKGERLAARRRAARRKRAGQRARRKAALHLDSRLDAETRRRAKLLTERRAIWKKLRTKRVAFYLSEARRMAGGAKARAINLVRQSERISKIAAQQAQASEELRLEATARAKHARRYAKATYSHGLRLPEAAAESEKAERRLTEISLIAAYAELEASWAKAAYKRNVLTWERFLAKNSQ